MIVSSNQWRRSMTLDDSLLDAIDQIVSPGGVAVFYLDDSFADFRPSHRW